jgi:hypothetical protein
LLKSRVPLRLWMRWAQPQLDPVQTIVVTGEVLGDLVPGNLHALSI